ncbi:carbohydrate-binding protein [Mucilaginibacter limnophilus]|uniref:Carbohydrate-binding protein n=1 Tax=Mucilaginibacter limnophilus TaxID=1932778 RepID=A0A437MRR3_9SPHI|nr:ThuA domain-containing protein [Mucilaginibacter limnophilus]RVU00325.1 carbohydrate-binding protein [Mucilaginibacter limnophilus]
MRTELYRKFFYLLLITAGISVIFYACKTVKPQTAAVKTPRVLVFSKTKGWYHGSIPSGIAALQKLGRENNFIVDTTKNAAYFNDDSLKNYSAVIFMSTTMNVLNSKQQVAFERYIEAGGGYVGVHAAADTEYDWPWYNKLVGAYFSSHPNYPNVRKATIDVIDTTHISTKGLPKRWERTDEWYNYRNIQPDLKVLATLDEDTYEGGTNGNVHPIAWYHEYDGGRAFYTGGGHTDESFSEPLFLQHLLGGIRYAIGSNVGLDYSKSYAVEKPEDNRFTKTVLSNDLNEPMELSVAPDGRVFFIERAGNFYVYDPSTQKTTLVYKFPVKAVDKYLNGLLGMSIDPDFATNNFLYFFNTAEAGGKYKQHISRFVISKDNQLDLKSEKVIIEIPIDLEVSAHTGGSISWDKYKNMYISTGDNTVPFESEGYAPIDRRPDRLTFDAERSAGNTNDLRGKILRIHPEANGTYTIPDGNLFAKGTANTRPEIYVMGCRNPYRMSVDTATSYVYWGEVGPDAGTDGAQGPSGYDEFNQAKKPGNYGWPYFVGDSKPYKEFDFATRTIGNNFDPAGPANLSPYSTGLKKLPPVQKPMVWYPYAMSAEFPFLGQGGRCAMGGPVYHYNANLPSASKLPAYYDKALFVYDWMRNWVYALRLDENYNYKRMEPFMETNGDFRRPVDIEIGPDGVMYMLEYGTVYGIDNVDARLVRIDYNGGNRAPIARINAQDTIGIAPYKSAFYQNSFDYDDEDKLTYEWRINNEVSSAEQNFTHTFDKNGVYHVTLKVTDEAGKSSIDSVRVVVGNTRPQIAITTTENGTFFSPKARKLNYKVDVKDAEDKAVDKKQLAIMLNYIAKVESNKALIGHQNITPTYNYGKELIANSDCKACHQINAMSVGPAFMAVSKKYAGKKEEINRLADKIIKGGGGVWGEHAMSAHPQLTKQNATEMVNYILSLSTKRNDVILPQQGVATLDKHAGNPDEGRYIISATYTDKGGVNAPALTGTSSLILRPVKVHAEDADVYSSVNMQDGVVGLTGNRSYFVLKNVDLKNISELTCRYASRSENGTLEVHIDALKGPLVSSLNFTATGGFDKFAEITAPVNIPQDRHDLYFVYPKKNSLNKNLVVIDWVKFGLQ